MENMPDAHSREEARTRISPLRSKGLSRFRAGLAFAACTGAVALSSCSAGQAESAEKTETTAPATASSIPSPGQESELLAEPSASQMELDGASPSGRAVLSEKGTGTGTYVVKGGLEAGQVLSMAASCTPGGNVTITRAGVGGYGVACSDPGTSLFSSAPDGEAEPEVEITVETDDGGPFWLMAWVHDAQ